MSQTATARDECLAEAGALYERDELEAAAAAFQRALALDPEHVEARYKLANSLKGLNRLEAAAEQYRGVLARNPRHAESLNNVGAIYQADELFDTAETCYLQAIGYKPGLAPPYVNLGRILQGQGRHDDAAEIYQRALDQGLDADLFGHLLAALKGAGTPRAPQNYVRETFDAFAAGFEQRVVGQLGYRVPGLLAGIVKPLLPAAAQVLDLGCGTGLAGDALRASGARLTGVDLSPRMLEVAAAKGCYQALHEADLMTWLQQSAPAAFDLVVAADVFIYIGDLDEVFAGVRRVLRAGGLFAFSVEACAEGDYRLQDTGRYAQSPGYVAALAARHGFSLRHGEPAGVRAGIEGDLYLLAL
jgi:predicted TPR repeat methyltransferase